MAISVLSQYNFYLFDFNSSYLSEQFSTSLTVILSLFAIFISGKDKVEDPSELLIDIQLLWITVSPAARTHCSLRLDSSGDAALAEVVETLEGYRSVDHAHADHTGKGFLHKVHHFFLSSELLALNLLPHLGIEFVCLHCLDQV